MAKPKKKGKSKKVAKAGRKAGKAVQQPSMQAQANAFLMQKKPLLRFLGIFLLSVILFYLFYNSNFYETNFKGGILSAQAYLSGGLLAILGYSNSIVGDVIQSDLFSISIAGGCDGLEATALFILAILAFPVPFRYKIRGIAVGVVILALLNILRITLLFLVGVHFNSMFEFFHLHGGVVLFSIVSIILWLIWLNWSFNQLSLQKV